MGMISSSNVALCDLDVEDSLGENKGECNLKVRVVNDGEDDLKVES